MIFESERVSPAQEQRDMAALLLFRRGLVELLHSMDRGFTSNPGENDSAILLAFGEALRGENFQNPLLTQAAFAGSARSFSEGALAYRSFLKDILKESVDSWKAASGTLPTTEAIERADDHTLLRIASRFLVGNSSPVELAIAEDLARGSRPIVNPLDTGMGVGFGIPSFRLPNFGE